MIQKRAQNRGWCCKTAARGPLSGHCHSSHPLPYSYWTSLDCQVPLGKGQAEVGARDLTATVSPTPQLHLTSPGPSQGDVYGRTHFSQGLHHLIFPTSYTCPAAGQNGVYTSAREIGKRSPRGYKYSPESKFLHLYNGGIGLGDITGFSSSPCSGLMTSGPSPSFPRHPPQTSGLFCPPPRGNSASNCFPLNRPSQNTILIHISKAPIA